MYERTPSDDQPFIVAESLPDFHSYYTTTHTCQTDPSVFKTWVYQLRSTYVPYGLEIMIYNKTKMVYKICDITSKHPKNVKMVVFDTCELKWIRHTTHFSHEIGEMRNVHLCKNE